MSAPMIGTTGHTRHKCHHAVSINEETMRAHTDNKETPMITEKSEMKSTDNGQNEFAVLNQKINDAQYWDNKVADIMRRVIQTLPAGKAPARLPGGLALGARLMTATALPVGTIHADEPTSTQSTRSW